MLVGYSQGGMDVQNIAAKATQYGLSNIQQIVTFGSAVGKYPTDIPSIHLMTNGDLAPWMMTVASPLWALTPVGDNSLVYSSDDWDPINAHWTYGEFAAKLDLDGGVAAHLADFKGAYVQEWSNPK